MIHKKNILFFIGGTFPAGGAERHLFRLIKNLKEAELYNIELMLINENFNIFEDLKIKIHHFKVGRRLISFQTLLSLIKIRKKIKKFALVHSFLNETNFISALFKLFNKKTKLIISKRNQDNWENIKLFYANSSNYFSDIITVNSRSMINWYENNEMINSDKIRYLPNSIESHWGFNEKKLDAKKIVITNVGNLNHKKNQIALIKAFAKLKKEIDNIVLKVVGKGKLYNDLDFEIKKLNIVDCVFLINNCDDVKPLFQKTDIFVLPSIKEGMSNALLEAMACGIYCIATDTGGSKELIKISGHGMLIKDNSDKEIYNCLKQVIINKKYDRSKEASKAVKSIFSVKNMIDEHLILYDDLIG
jgi:GalNAc-alpha-(1->4)-GalNAc-alpha-(1->3)-diNAcBac-PP-undecaprenol alpha-1,4-N-acetyl-D-galactosaminyltransferase